MIVSNNINSRYNYKNTTFTSRSKMLKDADDICRRVVTEFPATYSCSKLLKFDTLTKYSEGGRLQGYCDSLIKLSRKNYSAPSEVDYQLWREFANIKKYKVANCGELADATQIALKLNGYEDAKLLDLYAYNKDTKTMRNLDHSVVGLNFKLPDDYKYNIYNIAYNISPDFRIYPQNNSIIVDSWLGKAEYAKAITSEYNTNKGLIRGKSKYSYMAPDEKLLKEGEEFCFVPIYQPFKISDGALSHFGETYGSVILSKNRGKVDLSAVKKPPKRETIPEREIIEERKYYQMGEFKQKPEPVNKKNKMLTNLKMFMFIFANMF